MSTDNSTNEQDGDERDWNDVIRELSGDEEGSGPASGEVASYVKRLQRMQDEVDELLIHLSDRGGGLKRTLRGARTKLAEAERALERST